MDDHSVELRDLLRETENGIEQGLRFRIAQSQTAVKDAYHLNEVGSAANQPPYRTILESQTNYSGWNQ